MKTKKQARVFFIGPASFSILASLLFFSGTVASEDSDDDFVPEVQRETVNWCESDIDERAQDFMNNLVADVCDSVDTDPDVSDSQYAYESPDVEGCDLGMQMPGLPDFGDILDGIGAYDGFNLDACEVTQAITGGMVDSWNDRVGAYDDYLDERIDRLHKDTDLNQHINSTDDAMDRLDRWGDSADGRLDRMGDSVEDQF